MSAISADVASSTDANPKADSAVPIRPVIASSASRASSIAREAYASASVAAASDESCRVASTRAASNGTLGLRRLASRVWRVLPEDQSHRSCGESPSTTCVMRRRPCQVLIRKDLCFAFRRPERLLGERRQVTGIDAGGLGNLSLALARLPPVRSACRSSRRSSNQCSGIALS